MGRSPAPLTRDSAPLVDGRVLSALDAFPVLEHSSRRLRDELARRAGERDLVATIERDAAVTLRVLNAANRGPRRRGRASSVPAAVALLSRGELGAIADSTPAVDAVDPHGHELFEIFRRHALAVRQVVARLARDLDLAPERTGELRAAALIHDVGKLVLGATDGLYLRRLGSGPRSPREHLARERALWGTDHAAMGAAALRARGLPEELAGAVAHHHDADATGMAAVLRLADMLAHHSQGAPIDLEEMVQAAAVIEIERAALGELIYDLAYPLSDEAPVDACPLSERERQVLSALAQGLLYKQIALELDLATSTVRSHLHRIYGRLGVADRTQAVLVAAERGWLG